jgi:predicted double-glycine peptidase
MRPISFIALIVISQLFTGSALAERPVRSLLENRQENVVIQRWDNSCAAAALATVLTYDMGFPVTEERVARGMMKQTDPIRVKYRGGFSLLDMKKYAAQVGFESNGYSGMSLTDLAEQVPMIVPVWVRGYHHFVVVRYADEKEVHIADPAYGNYRVGTPRFVANWSGIGFQVEKRVGAQ